MAPAFFFFLAQLYFSIASVVLCGCLRDIWVQAAVIGSCHKLSWKGKQVFFSSLKYDFKSWALRVYLWARSPVVQVPCVPHPMSEALGLILGSGSSSSFLLMLTLGHS